MVSPSRASEDNGDDDDPAGPPRMVPVMGYASPRTPASRPQDRGQQGELLYALARFFAFAPLVLAGVVLALALASGPEAWRSLGGAVIEAGIAGMVLSLILLPLWCGIARAAGKLAPAAIASRLRHVLRLLLADLIVGAILATLLATGVLPAPEGDAAGNQASGTTPA